MIIHLTQICAILVMTGGGWLEIALAFGRKSADRMSGAENRKCGTILVTVSYIALTPRRIYMAGVNT